MKNFGPARWNTWYQVSWIQRGSPRLGRQFFPAPFSLFEIFNKFEIQSSRMVTEIFKSYICFNSLRPTKKHPHSDVSKFLWKTTDYFLWYIVEKDTTNVFQFLGEPMFELEIPRITLMNYKYRKQIPACWNDSFESNFLELTEKFSPNIWLAEKMLGAVLVQIFVKKTHFWDNIVTYLI